MSRVLVTGAGGPSAVSFMNAIAGPEVTCFAADIDPYAAGLYLVPPDQRWIAKRGDDPAFADDLVRYCVAEKIDVVVPTVDTELLPLASRRAELAALGIRLLVANEQTLAYCLDKAELLMRCAGACALPRWAILNDQFDDEAWSFPFLVKPRRSAGGRGVHIIRNDVQFATCSRAGDLLIQEYLPGREYSVDVFSDLEARVRAVVPRSRLKIDSGIAVAGRTLHDASLHTAASNVAVAIGLTFVGNVQFREDAQRVPRLLEVNARFPGTMPLTVGSGINMPRLAMDLLLGRPIPDPCDQFRDIAMVRTWREHFIDPGEVDALVHSARRDSSS